MELPDVGGQCAHASCGALDFLPHVCASCGLQFCTAHRMTDSHNCSGCQAPNVSREIALASYKPPEQQCNVPACSCITKPFIPCPECHRVVCVKHRNPSQHDCDGEKARKIAARDAVEKANQVAAASAHAKVSDLCRRVGGERSML